MNKNMRVWGYVVLLISVCVLNALTGQADAATRNYHIGIVTGTVSQAEDDLRGAEMLLQEYGSVADGGIIQHLVYPDNFMSETETTISMIVGLADDPLMKAIVVNQAIPGTTEAFRRVRERRPDIFLFAGEPGEDPLVIESAADIAVNSDFVSRGYLIIWAAKQLGAQNFVHVSFPRHMSYELLLRRRMIMEEACKDLGLKFAFESSPDPTSDVGVAGAQQFILEQVPQWVAKYGKQTAFFTTNDAQAEPLIKQVLANGAIYPDSDSPLRGYPGALGADLSDAKKDFPAIVKKLEEIVVAKGGKERLGTWAYSMGVSTSAGLGEFARRILDGEAKLDNFKDLIAAFEKFTPGCAWNGTVYTDSNTKTPAKNHYLLYQDIYVFGQGYLGTTKLEVPAKYYEIR